MSTKLTLAHYLRVCGEDNWRDRSILNNYYGWPGLSQEMATYRIYQRFTGKSNFSNHFGENSKSPFQTPEIFYPTYIFISHLRVKTTPINRTHTHGHITIDSCTDIWYDCTQLVQMNCTSVYPTHISRTHTRTLHFINI